jgi:predicted dehydrogenase
MLRLGLLGAGRWGQTLLRAFSRNAGVQVVAVSDPAAAALRQLRGPWRNASSPGALLEDTDIDAVVIATPSRTHAELTLDALRAQKHVFVEKPLAMCAADAQRVRSAVHAAGRVLMVGHVLEYHPAVRRLRALVRGQRLGRISSVFCERTSSVNANETEDPLWELGPHDISVLRFIFGQSPTHVVARRVERGSVRLTLSCRDGVSAEVVVGRSPALAKTRRCVVVGSAGVAVFDDMDVDAKLRVYPDQPGLRARLEAPSRAEARSASGPSLRDFSGLACLSFSPPGEPLALEVDHFVHAIATGTRVRSDVENGVAVVSVLEAAVQSLERNAARVAISADFPLGDSAESYV